MKYGRIVYAGSFGMSSINYGDYAQTFAIDYIYSKMGIDKSDIINIPYHSICNYEGEKVILPMNAYSGYMKETPMIPTSDSISPVFIGFHTVAKKYFEQGDFWKNHSPIGCRDESTFLEMKKKGYDAFLSGCMTILFPRRTKEPSKPHIFIVDAHKDVYKYIPEHIMKDAEIISQEYPVPKVATIEEACEINEMNARKHYERLYNEATLVITSRLHCASPCIAMGIPVILVRNGFDERYAWIDKYVPLYTPDRFSDINWNPTVPDIEEQKQMILKMAISMISGKNDKTSIDDVHKFYMTRDREKISSPFLVKCFNQLVQSSPKLAIFIREKVLSPFTIKSQIDNYCRFTMMGSTPKKHHKNSVTTAGRRQKNMENYLISEKDNADHK